MLKTSIGSQNSFVWLPAEPRGHPELQQGAGFSGMGVKMLLFLKMFKLLWIFSVRKKGFQYNTTKWWSLFHGANEWLRKQTSNMQKDKQCDEKKACRGVVYKRMCTCNRVIDLSAALEREKSSAS